MRVFLDEIEDITTPTVTDLPPAPQGAASLRGLRARAYQEHARNHRTSRFMRRLAFRADADLSIATGLVSVETEEVKLLKLLA